MQAHHIMAIYHRWLPRVIRGESNAASRERGGVCVVEVKLDDVDRIEWALKTFKKKVQRAGVLQDLRRKRHYVKPSEARQQKAAAARRRKRSRS
jgi:small subunit ribosomal protein S21